jgi:curved DNA-binding protein CbpA
VRGPDLPADDLYARLELPHDAATEAIEIAWRSLLKRHHPDVAGEESLETAKRINVAHDWLSDPTLRDRYDRARGTGRRIVRRSGGVRSGEPLRGRGGPASPARGESSSSAFGGHPAGYGRAPKPASDRGEERPPDLDLRSDIVRRFLDRVGRLSADEIDRLDLADTPPIAFVASIRRFLGEDRASVLADLEAAVAARMPAGSRGRPRARDAATSYGHHLVLAGFLADGLSEPFRERVMERMTRGWEAAVEQPRYGPNSREVAAFLERARYLSGPRAAAFLQAARASGLTTVRWPPGAHPTEDEGFRISVALAQLDAASSAQGETAASGGISTPAAVLRAVGGVAGTLALRPAFRAQEFGRLMAGIAQLGLIEAARPLR